ncbi:carbohydrate-binding module family 18 protein [Lophiostoma macrostomum CBS 122681]|uniref:chitinase n=1 Tax=Lophiostoma macrostomum CBS 122681 TaxID=1314788 RepID=A0A6A6THP0_9PLEO|nr:carbohydrate-binding module family 18 protein [Lophiostoma macrostomum CBS 122681]
MGFNMRAMSMAGLLASTVSAGFNAAASTNVAMYWGQGSSQIALAELCADESVDIVNLAFVNQFPREIGDYPATNFANACGSAYFSYSNGTASGLLSECPSIGPGIKTCQANGKKVLLSVGGGWPTDYYLESTEIAEYFAEFLWGAFGPQTDAWVADGKPRPFGDAEVDGFDLDIEGLMDPAPFDTYQYANYGHFVSYLKNSLFPTASGTYYISGAPQCVVPDARLTDAISTSSFDFIFVQFYNTAACSARAGYNGLSASSTAFTFDDWVSFLETSSADPSVKLYMGLPAGEAGAPYDTDSYLKPEEAQELISFYASKYSDIFGGVMLWEATVSSQNQICSKSYSSWAKDILGGSYIAPTCATSSSSIASSTSLVASTTTSSAIATATGISSPGGSCGPSSEGLYTCIGYFNGECCSAYGFCGSDSGYCGAGCQSAFGNCDSSSSSSSIASTSASKKGFTCVGYFNGECCSAYGFCGGSTDYCEAGCQEGFGKCSPSATSTAVPEATAIPSPDGGCGPQHNNYTCIRYHMGECCSTNGFCGSTANYCSNGCQSLFGECDSSTSSSTASETSVASSSSTFASANVTFSSTSSTISSSSSFAMVSSSVVLSNSSTLPPSTVIATSTPSVTGLYPSVNATSSTAHPTSGTSFFSHSSSIELPYPSGNTTSGIAYPTSGASSVVLSSSVEVPYPSGNATSSLAYPTGGISSALPSSLTELPYPTGENTTYGYAYPTGNSTSDISYPSSESSVAYPTFSYPTGNHTAGYGTGYPMPSGSSYPTSTSSNVDGQYPGSGHGQLPYETSSSHVETVSPSGASYSTPCSDDYSSYPTASGTSRYEAYPGFPSESGSYGAYPASSSASYGEYAGESASVHGQDGVSSTPCSTPAAAYPTDYASSFSGHLTSTSSGGYEAYPSAPAVTSKPSYPLGGHSASADTTVTTITTEYVDVCSTGLTTVTITTLKTVCPVCSATPTPSGVPEGWYTTVTVCEHCGPLTTTVTLTKPMETGSFAVPTYPASSFHSKAAAESVSAAQYSGSTSSYSQASFESAPAARPSGSGSSSYPASVESIPATQPSAPSHSEEPAESTPSLRPTGPTFAGEKHQSQEAKQRTATNTVYQYVTMTVSPVPYASSVAPYQPANNTAVYVPTAAGVASSTHSSSSPYSTHVPEEFEGAASRLNVGITVTIVLIAGLGAL